MKRKVYVKAGLACVLGVTVLLPAVSFVQSARAGGGIFLRPPFDGTYRVTAYFDHNRPTYCTGANGVITIYNGESVAANCNTQTGDPYPYDGHDGWDWSMATGTDVLAAAAGWVVYSDVWGCYGDTIVIDHHNGYYTMYSHLSQRLIGANASVTAGQHIGESGNSVGPGCDPVGAHLHFGVRHGGYLNTTYATDPFGWRGPGRDPLFDYNGKVSTCLWRNHDEDPISCADTIVEDAGAGSVAFPSANWQVSNRGNGYHTFYRSNTATQYDYHTWSTSAISNPLRPGPCKVYVFVPEDPDIGGNPLSQQVTYQLWTASGWQQTGPVNQSTNVNRWVPLGTYWITRSVSAGMWAYTGETVGTRWVTADAFKWRQYHTYLPLVLNNYPPCSPGYGQLIVNGNFSTGDATGWTVSRTNGPAPIVQPYAGTDYGAYLGRYNLNQDMMYQFVCPASPVDYASLSFWWWVSSQDSPYVDVDFLYVRVRDANGNLLQTLKTITNRSPQGQWYVESFDLRAYAGQTIRISFEASTDGSYPTHFWIDGVSFAVYDW